MLFGYPVAATNDNWLHECLFETIGNVHTTVDAGNRYPRWPTILPAAQRVKLRASTGLQDRLANYDKAVRKLSKANRARILKAVGDQNRISDLVSGKCNCAKLTELPKTVHKSTKSLFDYAYERLTDLGVRDSHYSKIYASTPDHVCPFCGAEYMDAPGAPREDLDHYLAKSLYPFAAANLRNLVPMGHKCNSSYKLAIDIMWRTDGTRRVAFDPYNHAEIAVLLDDSDPFHGTIENTPRWEIHFAPDTPAVSTWDDVFSVRVRYCRDHLNPSYARWLGLFGVWVRSSGLEVDTDEAIVAALQCYENYWVESGMHDRAFLKAAVFRMLRRHCEAGHQRLLNQIKDLVTHSSTP